MRLHFGGRDPVQHGRELKKGFHERLGFGVDERLIETTARRRESRAAPGDHARRLRRSDLASRSHPLRDVHSNINCRRDVIQNPR